jgi:large subunit ribosomal protein L25
MKQLQLTVTTRAGNGRGPSRRLREAGSIPAVIYGKSGNQLVTVESTAFRTLMRAKGQSAALIDLKVEGKGSLLSLIKEYQRHPITQKFLHIDLLEIDPAAQMTADIPVRLVGEPVGVKMDGGTLNQISQSVRVRCLPKDLPEFIDVDVSELKVDDSIHVGEMKPPPGITFPGDKKRVIAVVTEMAAEEAAATTAVGAPVVGADGVAAPAAAGAAPAAGAAAAAAPAAPAKK